MSTPNTAPVGRKSPLRRVLPLVVLALGLAAFFGLGLHRQLSFDALRDNRVVLMDLVSRWGVLAGLGYAMLYAAVVACSLPIGLLL
ncbi:MAG: TVP38/TMEM64 family protein, partial [Alphaproteobacteria bacterium]|nr:TVP38/TMEM64 family protein [Alphaproteobacteria bacterium]